MGKHATFPARDALASRVRLHGDLSAKDQKRVKEFVLHYREELLQMWKTQQFKALKPLK